MTHENERTQEPQDLGVASVATQGAAWPVPELEGYRISLGISED